MIPRAFPTRHDSLMLYWGSLVRDRGHTTELLRAQDSTRGPCGTIISWDWKVGSDSGGTQGQRRDVENYSKKYNILESLRDNVKFSAT